MSTNPNVETPRLRLTVAEEAECNAANKISAWLKTHAPPAVNQCFSGMRALSTFVSEAQRGGGKVSKEANQTVLNDLGTVVNAISEIDRTPRKKRPQTHS